MGSHELVCTGIVLELEETLSAAWLHVEGTSRIRSRLLRQHEQAVCLLTFLEPEVGSGAGFDSWIDMTR